MKGLDLIIRKPLVYFIHDVISIYEHLVCMYRYDSAYLVENDLERKASDKRLLRGFSYRQVEMSQGLHSAKASGHRVSSTNMTFNCLTLLLWFRDLSQLNSDN